MTKKKKYLDVRCTQDEYDQQISNGRIQDNNNAYFVPNDSKIVSSNNKASLNQNKNTPKNNIP
jgi:hypothetical protein